MKYLYVDLEAFAKQYKCKSQEDLGNALVHWASSVPHNCIVIDSFFTCAKQADVFLQHFAKP